MKKPILFFLILFGVSTSVVAQDTESITEERSSGWVKVPDPRPAATTTTRRTPAAAPKPAPATRPPATPPPPRDEFSEKNKQVNRFRKKN